MIAYEFVRILILCLHMYHEIIESILVACQLNPDLIVISDFMELNVEGEDLEPAGLGITNSHFVIAWKYGIEDDSYLYHIYPLATVKLFPCCIHYKKITVVSCFHEARYFRLQRPVEYWPKWVEAIENSARHNNVIINVPGDAHGFIRGLHNYRYQGDEEEDNAEKYWVQGKDNHVSKTPYLESDGYGIISSSDRNSMVFNKRGTHSKDLDSNRKSRKSRKSTSPERQDKNHTAERVDRETQVQQDELGHAKRKKNRFFMCISTCCGGSRKKEPPHSDDVTQTSPTLKVNINNKGTSTGEDKSLHNEVNKAASSLDDKEASIDDNKASSSAEDIKASSSTEDNKEDSLEDFGPVRHSVDYFQRELYEKAKGHSPSGVQQLRASVNNFRDRKPPGDRNKQKNRCSREHGESNGRNSQKDGDTVKRLSSEMFHPPYLYTRSSQTE